MLTDLTPMKIRTFMHSISSKTYADSSNHDRLLDYARVIRSMTVRILDCTQENVETAVALCREANEGHWNELPCHIALATSPWYEITPTSGSFDGQTVGYAKGEYPGDTGSDKENEYKAYFTERLDTVLDWIATSNADVDAGVLCSHNRVLPVAAIVDAERWAEKSFDDVGDTGIVSKLEWTISTLRVSLVTFNGDDAPETLVVLYGDGPISTATAFNEYRFWKPGARPASLIHQCPVLYHVQDAALLQAELDATETDEGPMCPYVTPCGNYKPTAFQGNGHNTDAQITAYGQAIKAKGYAGLAFYPSLDVDTKTISWADYDDRFCVLAQAVA